MAGLKQRKVVLPFFDFGNSFPTCATFIQAPGYTVFKAQTGEVEVCLTASGNDEFIMTSE